MNEEEEAAGNVYESTVLLWYGRRPVGMFEIWR